MGFIPKKILHAIWGVRQPKQRLDAPIDCSACRIARMNGGDACWEHHEKHPRAHTYHMGHEANWGSGLDGRSEAMTRPSSESIS